MAADAPHPGQLVIDVMKTELRASVAVGSKWLEWEAAKPDGMPEAFREMIDAVLAIIDGAPITTDYQLYSLLTLYRFYLRGQTPESTAQTATGRPEQRN